MNVDRSLIFLFMISSVHFEGGSHGFPGTMPPGHLPPLGPVPVPVPIPVPVPTPLPVPMGYPSVYPPGSVSLHALQQFLSVRRQ